VLGSGPFLFFGGELLLDFRSTVSKWIITDPWEDMVEWPFNDCFSDLLETL